MHSAPQMPAAPAAGVCTTTHLNRQKSSYRVNGLIKRNPYGFTLIEIIAVLLLMSIIAATVLGRAISTEQLELRAQFEKVQNHVRYAHTMAMKYGDQVWGFRCAGNAPNEYWIFRLDLPVADPVNDPNTPANQVQLPGETDVRVNLTQNDFSMTTFTIFFDRYGRPYTSYTDETNNAPLASALTISMTAGGAPGRSFVIIPETGYLQ